MKLTNTVIAALRACSLLGEHLREHPLLMLKGNRSCFPAIKSRLPGLLIGMSVLWVTRVVAFEAATAVATVTDGSVTGITVISGGSGYTREPKVTLSGGGGSGATAKAVLSGNKLGSVLVLTAGSGYQSSPTVTIGEPSQVLRLEMQSGPRIRVNGEAGSAAVVEWAEDLSGPWRAWSNVVVGVDGTALLDLTPGSGHRFYRAAAESSPSPQPVGPAGFVWIPPGTFVMGSPVTEPRRFPEEVQHPVTLTEGFWLSDHEVTQGEYEAVMGSNPSNMKGDPNRPVERVIWDEAVLYCQKLTERERGAGRITAQQAYRLPTEAEWEYAARAGTIGARHGELDAIAWYDGNSVGTTHAVKGKQANAWGLHDMLGNVWEWCSDLYGPYPRGAVTDPTGPSEGFLRMCRGGAWNHDAWGTRSASRGKGDPGFRYNNVGFRPALSSVR